MLEKVEGRRKRGNQRMRQLDVINNVMDMMVRDREALPVHGVTVRPDWVTEQHGQFCSYNVRDSFIAFKKL